MNHTHAQKRSVRPLSILSGRALFWVGIGLVLVGLVALFRYSLEQEWFRPELRLGLGAGLAAAMVAVGLVIRRPVYGRLLQGAGTAGLYATAWASYGRYGFVDESGAFLQLGLVSALAVGLAFREQSESLAAVGFVGAGLAPTLIGGTMAGSLGDAPYLIPVLWLSSILYVSRGWWISQTAAVLTVGTTIGATIVTDERSGSMAIAVVALGLAGWAVPRLSHMVGRGPAVSIDTLVVMTMSMPLITWALLSVVVSGGMVPAVVGSVFALAQLALFWVHRSDVTSLIDGVVGLGLLALSIAGMLSAPATYPVLVLLGFAAAAAGSRIETPGADIVAQAVAAITAFGWGGVQALGTATLIGDVVVVVGVAGTVLATAPGRRVVTGSLGYLMALVAISTHGGVADTGWVTTGWALLGLAAVVYGQRRRGGLATAVGLATLAVAIAKLVFFDMAQADPLVRVGSAIGIGLALLAVGYWIGDADLVSGVNGERVPVAGESESTGSANQAPGTGPVH